MVASEACLVVLREMPIAMRVVEMLGVLVWQQSARSCKTCQSAPRENACDSANRHVLRKRAKYARGTPHGRSRRLTQGENACAQQHAKSDGNRVEHAKRQRVPMRPCGATLIAAGVECARQAVGMSQRTRHERGHHGNDRAHASYDATLAKSCGADGLRITGIITVLQFMIP